jgi:hypothetical protein
MKHKMETSKSGNIEKNGNKKWKQKMETPKMETSKWKHQKNGKRMNHQNY